MEMQPIKKFSKNTTIELEVKFAKQFFIRMKIAIVLIRLAAFISGCGITILDRANNEKSDNT